MSAFIAQRMSVNVDVRLHDQWDVVCPDCGLVDTVSNEWAARGCAYAHNGDKHKGADVVTLDEYARTSERRYMRSARLVTLVNCALLLFYFGLTMLPAPGWLRALQLVIASTFTLNAATSAKRWGAHERTLSELLRDDKDAPPTS